MRGKTRTTPRNCGRKPCFNEAPAECGGKRRERGGRPRRVGRASMRPPQNAGENESAERPTDEDARASMRPPQNAGENRPA